MKLPNFFRSLFSLCALLAVHAAFAQSPAPAPAAAAAPLEAPPARHLCPKPAIPLATKKPEPAEMNAFVTSLDTFRDCVQAYAQAQQKISDAQQKNADALGKAAQASVAAGNAAIKEYNDLVEQANKTFNAKPAS